ncbi:protein kinase domain-containing protein [Bacillus thuringiensis]|uniref:protein kinase domain-containing protein n=1 Tax=Bacillus thuringiensis TaxID=1428 RepID=UPI001EE003B0|nr:protein kinase [Bacillus thuringiensis]MCG3426780.1 protein kinase [Bacillus thuringiensis]
MKDKRRDYHFKNNTLKLVPLDENEEFSRENWIQKNRDISNWLEISIPDVSLIEFIGCGANGIVLKAKESITGRICALKIWLPNTNSRHYSVYFNKYQEEITKIARLDMPSIVTIYKAGITDSGYCYSTMEWVEGITLKDFLADNTNLRDELRYKILNDILLTINECHKINVLHGDLHDENILLEPLDSHKGNYKVKILDFGTSLLNRHKSVPYSKQRESALLLQTVLKLLPVEEKYNLLNFKFYSFLNQSRVAIKHNDDVRNVEPIIVSSALLQLCEVYALVEMNYFNDTVFIDMLTHLLSSTQLNANKVWEYIYIKGTESELNIKHLLNILSERMGSFIFEPHFRHVDLQQLELTFSIYELSKNTSNLQKYEDFNLDDFDINNFDYKKVLNLKSIEDVIEFLTFAKHNSYEDEYINFLTELYESLSDKYAKEYEPTNGYKRDLDLIFKLNELRLIRNSSIEEILDWEEV